MNTLQLDIVGEICDQTGPSFVLVQRAKGTVPGYQVLERPKHSRTLIQSDILPTKDDVLRFFHEKGWSVTWGTTERGLFDK